MNYLYQITNLINNKIYVGVHKNKINTVDDGYMGSGGNYEQVLDWLFHSRAIQGHLVEHVRVLVSVYKSSC
jgi:hypothetical protein